MALVMGKGFGFYSLFSCPFLQARPFGVQGEWHPATLHEGHPAVTALPPCTAAPTARHPPLAADRDMENLAQSVHSSLLMWSFSFSSTTAASL